MIKIHNNKHVKGKIAKRPEEARKGLSPNLGKNTSNLPTKESTKKKQNLTLPVPSKHFKLFNGSQLAKMKKSIPDMSLP